jgi:peptide/bleomycin uptake transporter
MLVDQRTRVTEQLRAFVVIVIPLVVVAPAAKWVRSEWSFAWRRELMRSYLMAWDTNSDPMEGASQRLHEDTQRFAKGLDGCISALLDAVFTLAVFGPILVDLSAKVLPPRELVSLHFHGAWLFVTALLAAVVGLMGSMVIGRKLVRLEVANQRVEAMLRRDLVLLEAMPSSICGNRRNRGSLPNPAPFFWLTLKRLSANYHALYRNFTGLNAWLICFDQVMVILPYTLVAHLLFADEESDRITLGVLIQVSNSFEKVFSSLAIVGENWAQVNEFRSVLVRLKEFELAIYKSQKVRDDDRLLTKESSTGTPSGPNGPDAGQTSPGMAEPNHVIVQGECRHEINERDGVEIITMRV